MLSILRKSATKTSRSTPSEQCVVVSEELSTWEFVDASLTDDEDLYSVDEDDVISQESASKVVNEEEEAEEKTKGACESRDLGPLDDFTCLQSLHDERCDDDEEEEEEDEDDVYDDDDLVPWKLKGRFGKQRIIKIGKRGGPKPARSSKLPCYYHIRPKTVYENRQVKPLYA